MVLRYLWGEGIGHIYAHSDDYHWVNYVIRSPESASLVASDSRDSGGIGIDKAGDAGNGEDSEEEFTLKDREELDWDDEMSVPGETEEGMESDDLGSDPDWVDK